MSGAIAALAQRNLMRDYNIITGRKTLLVVLMFLGLLTLERLGTAIAAEPPRVIVAARNADLYSAPSFDSRIVRSVKAGTALDVKGRTSDSGWWQVSGDAGSISYVRSSLVEPNPAALTLPVLAAANAGDVPTPTPTAPPPTVTPTATAVPPTPTATASPTPLPRVPGIAKSRSRHIPEQ